MVLPTMGSAATASEEVCSEIRLCRFLLVLICCSTSLNETSCCVNALVSIGEVGSWFLSCVVSSVRKVLRFEPSSDASLELVEPVLVLLVAWLDGVGVAAAATGVVIMGSSDLDVQEADMRGLARTGDGRGDGKEVIARVAAGRRLRCRIARLSAALVAALRVATQIEAQAAAIGVQTGVAQRLLQLAGAPLQLHQGVAAVGGDHGREPAVVGEL